MLCFWGCNSYQGKVVTVMKKIALVGLGILFGLGVVFTYTALSARYFPTDLTVKFYLRLHGIKSEVNCAVYDGSHNHVNISCSAEPSQIQALTWIRDLTWLSCRCAEFDLTDVVNCQSLERIDISGGVFRHPELFLRIPNLQFACGHLEEPLTNNVLCELTKEWPLCYRLTNDNMTYFLSEGNAKGKPLWIMPDILDSMEMRDIVLLKHSGAESVNGWRPDLFFELYSTPSGDVKRQRTTDWSE